MNIFTQASVSTSDTECFHSPSFSLHFRSTVALLQLFPKDRLPIFDMIQLQTKAKHMGILTHAAVGLRKVLGVRKGS